MRLSFQKGTLHGFRVKEFVDDGEGIFGIKGLAGEYVKVCVA
jgi:hypothetical protein